MYKTFKIDHLILNSIFNKNTANDIGEFLSRRFYLIPSLIALFVISFIDSNLHEIGTFPKEWKLSIRQPISNAVESLTVDPGFIAFYLCNQ